VHLGGGEYAAIVDLPWASPPRSISFRASCMRSDSRSIGRGARNGLQNTLNAALMDGRFLQEEEQPLSGYPSYGQDGVLNARRAFGDRPLLPQNRCPPTPKSPKGVRASVKSPRKLLTAFQDSSNLAPSWSRVLFHRETKPGSRRSGRDPKPNSYPKRC
jgi:hypothetical protein